MLVEFLAKTDKLIRPYIVKYFPLFSTKIYSLYRKDFLNLLIKSIPKKIHLSEDLNVKVWDISFNCNLFNSAGMFKNGFGYLLCYNQSAGAFLAGTTTYNIRLGNKKNNIEHPFIPLPKSKAALNWFGLPNDGHTIVANRLSQIEKKKNCPIGISISIDPEINENLGMKYLIEGFKLYEKANVDFIELNESCPNVEHSNNSNNLLDNNLILRLEYIRDKFLKYRNRNLPVVVKFASDTDLEQIPELIRLLVDMGFDGVNFGNTVKNYNNYINKIDNDELVAFNNFTNTFGGGLSGYPIKDDALRACKIAVEIRNKIKLSNQFAIIRTGGIFSYEDIEESNRIGVDLNQWFTGYFEQFSNFGHKIYKNIYKQ